MFRRIFSAIVGYFVRRAGTYRLRVTYADGSSRSFYDGGGEPDIHIVFKTARAERRAVLNHRPHHIPHVRRRNQVSCAFSCYAG